MYNSYKSKKITCPFVFAHCGVTGVNFTCGFDANDSTKICTFTYSVDDAAPLQIHVPYEYFELADTSLFNKLNICFFVNTEIYRLRDIINVHITEENEKQLLLAICDGTDPSMIRQNALQIVKQHIDIINTKNPNLIPYVSVLQTLF